MTGEMSETIPKAMIHECFKVILTFSKYHIQLLHEFLKRNFLLL